MPRKTKAQTEKALFIQDPRDGRLDREVDLAHAQAQFQAGKWCQLDVYDPGTRWDGRTYAEVRG